jgi:hypothetical protein
VVPAFTACLHHLPFLTKKCRHSPNDNGVSGVRRVSWVSRVSRVSRISRVKMDKRVNRISSGSVVSKACRTSEIRDVIRGSGELSHRLLAVPVPPTSVVWPLLTPLGREAHAPIVLVTAPRSTLAKPPNPCLL